MLFKETCRLYTLDLEQAAWFSGLYLTGEADCIALFLVIKCLNIWVVCFQQYLLTRCAYLLRGTDKDEVVRAIVAVERGEAIFSSAIAQGVIQYFLSSPSALCSR